MVVAYDSETHLSRPRVGSRLAPIESLNRCRLIFSAVVKRVSSGKVKKRTEMISW